MTAPSIIWRFGFTRSVAVVVLMMLAILGCEGDAPPRSQAVDDTSAARLAGTWDITLRLERPMSFSTNLKMLPRSVNGTMAFVEDHHARVSLADLSGLTHTGVYDIRLDSLELPRWNSDRLRAVMARLRSGVAPPDSLFLVLNPESPGHFIVLSGELDDGIASGTWVADSPLSGGGTFTLRRRAISSLQ